MNKDTRSLREQLEHAQMLLAKTREIISAPEQWDARIDELRTLLIGTCPCGEPAARVIDGKLCCYDHN